MRFDQERLEQVFRESGVAVAYLFGSQATGRARPDSDVDVAVLFADPVTLRDEVRLEDRLAEALAVPKVDVLNLEHSRLELRGRVLEEGRLLFSDDEPRRVEYEVRTFKEWLDFRPWLDRMSRAFIAHVAQRGFNG